ncbi:MAG: GAF domain-containing protein [Thermodesulfobacteriota bacterium]
MKPSEKTSAITVTKLLLFSVFILISAFVVYRLFSAKFQKLETLEKLSSNLIELRISMVKVEYTMDMVMSSERFDPTLMTFIKRDVEKVEAKLDEVVNEDSYRWFFTSSSIISEEISTMSVDWQSIVSEIQQVGPYTKKDEVMLIHNNMDINSILIDEKFDRLFVFIRRARAETFKDTRILLTVTLAFFVISALTAILFYHITITRPLWMISATARSYASGSGNVRFRSTYAGLLGVVSGELNNILDAVKEREIISEEKNRAAADELSKKDSEMDTLGRLSSFAGRSLSLREILAEAAKTAISAGGADAACVYIQDKYGSFNIEASEGFDDSFLKEAGELPAAAFGGRFDPSGAVLVKNLDEIPFKRYAGALKSAGFSTLLSLRFSAGENKYGFIHTAFKTAPVIDKTAFFKALASSIETFAGYTGRYHNEHGRKKFFERIINQIPYGLAVFDGSGTCLLANDMLRKLMGAGPNFDFTRKYRIFDDEILTTQGMVPTIKKSYEGFVTEFIIDYNPSSVKQFRFMGPARKLKIKSTPLYNAGGEIKNIALLYEDISSQDETARTGGGKV